MQDKLENRLKQLRDEYTNGQQVAADLQNKLAEVQQTLLRISGAIQVLEELSQGGAPSANDAPVRED